MARGYFSSYKVQSSKLRLKLECGRVLGILLTGLKDRDSANFNLKWDGFAEEGSRTETFETTLCTHFTAHCNTITRRQVNMLGKTGVTANRDKI